MIDFFIKLVFFYCVLAYACYGYLAITKPSWRVSWWLYPFAPILLPLLGAIWFITPQ